MSKTIIVVFFVLFFGLLLLCPTLSTAEEINKPEFVLGFSQDDIQITVGETVELKLLAFVDNPDDLSFALFQGFEKSKGKPAVMEIERFYEPIKQVFGWHIGMVRLTGLHDGESFFTFAYIELNNTSIDSERTQTATINVFSPKRHNTPEPQKGTELANIQ